MRYLSRLRPRWPRRWSLRTVLIAPFVLQIALAFALVATISFQQGRAAVHATIGQLQDEIARNIEREIDRYLNDARRAIEFSADEIALGHLDLDDRDGLRAYLFLQLQRFEGLGYTAIATESGQYVGISRIGKDGTEILLDWFGDDGRFEKWQLDGAGQPTRQVQVRDDYDHRERPWYRAAVDRGAATWSEVFQYHGSQLPVISANQPFYDADGQLVGVVSTDLRLEQIGDFLASLEIGETGGAFVLDDRGQTIAASEPKAALRDANVSRAAIDSSLPMVREVSARLLDRSGELPEGRSERIFEIDGDRVLVDTIPYGDDQPGLDWTIVVVVPERDFMGPIFQMSRDALRVCVLAIAIAIGAGILTAQRIAEPIRALAQASRTLSSHFDRSDLADTDRVPSQNIYELHLLATAFAKMAIRLRASFRQLETANQQLEARVQARTRALQEANHALQRLAAIDGLTQIANRRRFDDRFAACWRGLAVRAFPLAVVLGDVDHFKLFNDTYGHQAGDDCLQRVARAIDRAVENATGITDTDISGERAGNGLLSGTPYDSGGDSYGDLCDDGDCSALTARYGGEEFAILLPGFDRDRIRAVLDAVQAEVAALAIPHARSSAAEIVSLSLGVATIVPNDTSSTAQLLEAADRALYAAKSAGRNGYCFAPALDRDALRESSAESEPEPSPASSPISSPIPPAERSDCIIGDRRDC